MIKFLEQITAKIQHLEHESNLAYWNLAVTGDEKYADEVEKYNIELKRLFSSKEDYEFIRSLKKVSDPLIERQLTLLKFTFIENQIPESLITQIVKLETLIESIYTNFRATVDGKHLSNNDIKEILTSSLDVQLREKAWKASKEIGAEVSEKILQLVALRNQGAKQVGFENYYQMKLHSQELDEKQLFDLLKDLELQTDDLWQRFKTSLDDELCDKFETDVVTPWLYGDPFFQEAPHGKVDLDRFYQAKDIVSISRDYFSSIGLDVDDIIHRSDLFEREHKNQHAFCISLDRSTDVRILCNIRNDEYWMCTQLHELGHAVYDKFIDPSLPFLLRTPAHTSITEASAMLFGRLSKDETFIKKFVNPDTQLDLSKLSTQFLVFARWVLVMVHFERELYRQPESDLNTLWWDMVEKFQWVKRPPDRNSPDWAAKLHLACAPVYYQNYILGEMTASQLSAKIGDLFSPTAGTFLKEKLYLMGAELPWDKTIEKTTGEPLNPQYFVADIQKNS